MDFAKRMEQQNHSTTTKSSELGRFADRTEESQRREMTASNKEELHKIRRNGRVAMKEENKEQSALFNRRIRQKEKQKQEKQKAPSGSAPAAVDGNNKRKDKKAGRRGWSWRGGKSGAAAAPKEAPKKYVSPQQLLEKQKLLEEQKLREERKLVEEQKRRSSNTAKASKQVVESSRMSSGRFRVRHVMSSRRNWLNVGRLASSSAPPTDQIRAKVIIWSSRFRERAPASS